MRLIIVGPQGVGKGTQAKILANFKGIPHISTGDIFRDNMDCHTVLGEQVQEIINHGSLVNDEIVNRMVVDRLSQKDVQDGFILDGYPRNADQVEFLDQFLDQRGQAIDLVVSLVAPKEYLVQRMNKRAQEEGRSDDTDEAISHRLEEFERQTKPIIDLYEKRNLVVTINATGTIDDVSKTMLAMLMTRLS
ncbi:MAG: adenylate kinase [Bifidobacteriaceae bacterium]|jgi:adenylate kinase|nr:adenylate kinase [Bifidobacteriaceae bacterium]